MIHRVGLVIVLAAALGAGAPDVPAGQGDGAPDVPALVAGGGPPKSFVVEGVLRFTERHGFAFYVATDGRRELCAVYDLTDGTPLFISDGRQTLVYDVMNGRVVRIDPSRGFVRVQWLPGNERPVKFEAHVHVKPDEELRKMNSWFRIDEFVRASGARLKRLESDPGTLLYAAERDDGGVESVQTRPRDPGWFRFTSLSKGDAFYRLELETKHVGGKPPDDAFGFPDVRRLARDDVPVAEFDPGDPEFARNISGGLMWAVKVAVSGAPMVRDQVEKGIPKIAWDRLRERDVEAGAKYRSALALQGFRFPGRKQAGIK